NCTGCRIVPPALRYPLALAVDLTQPLFIPVRHDDWAKPHLPHPLHHLPRGGNVLRVTGQRLPRPINGGDDIAHPRNRHDSLTHHALRHRHGQGGALQRQNLVPRHRSPPPCTIRWNVSSGITTSHGALSALNATASACSSQRYSSRQPSARR